MAVQALTIDFWNTMVVARTGGVRRQEQRMQHLIACVQACRPDVAVAAVEAAYQEACRRFDTSWQQQHTTPTTSNLVRCIWDELELDPDAVRHADTVTVFEEGLLHGPPSLAEGVEEALAWAAARYRLGIISDTMFSPGRVIRRFLEQRGVLHYFDAFVFSDETGFSKPDVRAFQLAADRLGVVPSALAHIGDLRRTDVAGARRAQASAILFCGVCEDPDAPDGPAPDAVLGHWRDLPRVLAPGVHPEAPR